MEGLSKPTDGLISRYLNRRLSLPLSRLVVARGWPISADAMSLISFSLAVIAGVLFALRQPLAAGILAQASSVLDGCDGEIARLTGRESARGAVLDAILDRLADSIIFLGMALFALTTASPVAALSLGFLALIGAYGVSYSSAIARAHGYPDFLRIIAGRDARLFLIMLAGIVAAFVPSALLYFLGFLALAGLSELSGRLIRIWRSG